MKRRGTGCARNGLTGEAMPKCCDCKREHFASELLFCDDCSLRTCKDCKADHQQAHARLRAKLPALHGVSGNGSAAPGKSAQGNPGSKAFEIVPRDSIPTACVRATGDPELRLLLRNFKDIGDHQALRWRLNGTKAQKEASKGRVKGFLARNDCRFSSKSDADWLYVWKREPTTGRRNDLRVKTPKGIRAAEPQKASGQ